MSDNQLQLNEQRALELLRDGKTISEILAMIPNAGNEAQKMLESAQTLMSARELIQSPHEEREYLFQKLQHVTERDMERIVLAETPKGRTPLYEVIHHYSDRMAINWKIIAPVFAVFALVVIAGYYEWGIKDAAAPLSSLSSAPTAMNEPVAAPADSFAQNIPAPTGNVDDAVSAMIAAAIEEMTMLEFQTESDAGLINVDSQAISDFGQIYDENTL